jgi:hypothetical protein
MIIVRARLKPHAGATEFISVKGRIKSLLEKNKGDNFHFVIDDGGVKTVKEFGVDNINPELVGQKVQICEGPYLAQFNEDGTIDIVIDLNEGALPRQSTVDQLKRIRKMTKGIDIGDRIPDLKKQGANLQYYQNPVDTGIESYEDFEKKNKKFIPSWNLKHLLSPFGHDKKIKNNKK